MHKKMPATTWLAWVHVFNYFTCLLDRGASKKGTDYEYITVHFLRHANATLLIMNDVDIKVVSSHLGYNDIQTTANIYADVLKSKEHQIAQLIEFNLEDDQ